MSALERLDVLRAQVVERKDRVAEADRIRLEAPRAGDSAHAELMAYHRELGEGEPEDPKLLESLTDKLVAARAGLVPKQVQVPLGPGVVDIREVLVDPAAEARYEGTVAALEIAQSELAVFIAEEMGPIAAERFGKAQIIRHNCTDALTAAHKAANEYEAERAWWAGLLIEGARDDLIGLIPDHPLRFMQDAPREGALPIPTPFVP